MSVAASRESDRALLIVDMTVALVGLQGHPSMSGAPDLVRFIQGELRYFRERGRPVFFAVTAGRDGTLPQLVQELTPRTGEAIVSKKAFSAFFDTTLAEQLRHLGVRRLTLVGVETNTSILLTAADAVAHGFHVVVPEPCVWARHADDHRFALRQIREVWPREQLDDDTATDDNSDHETSEPNA